MLVYMENTGKGVMGTENGVKVTQPVDKDSPPDIEDTL